MLLEQRIKECVAKDFLVKPEVLTTNFNFEKEGFDSLDIVEAVMALEEEFDIDLPDHLLSGFTTYGELESCILEHVQ